MLTYKIIGGEGSFAVSPLLQKSRPWNSEEIAAAIEKYDIDGMATVVSYHIHDWKFYFEEGNSSEPRKYTIAELEWMRKNIEERLTCNPMYNQSSELTFEVSEWPRAKWS